MWWFRVAWQIVLLSLLAIAGDAIVAWLGIPIPGPLIGMALLFLGLVTGVVRLSWIEDGADVLIRDIILFFVPAAVGIMQYKELFGTLGALLVGAVFISILLMLWTISVCTVYITKLKRKGWRRS